MRDQLSALEERLLEPSARGLVSAVSAAIRERAVLPGQRLPPIRTVAIQLGLSPTTVSAAWALLARSGAIRTDGRRGTTVADSAGYGAGRYRRALQYPSEFAVDLSTGVPDHALLPDLRPAVRSLTTAAAPGSYLDDPVLPELIEILAADWPYAADGFTVTDGAMDAIELVARTVLRFGDRVVVEHPCFPPLLDLLEALGAYIVGVPLDSSGLQPAALAAAMSPSAAAVVLQPRAHNPTGISMTNRRARELSDVLTAADAWIIEDDSAGAVAQATPISLGQWLPNRVVHVRSFSKSHGPDLRLAAVSCPSELLAEITAKRHLGQGWSSRLLQRILVHLLTDARAKTQVVRARDEYARRRALAVARLADHGIAVPGDDGLNIWMPVADESATTLWLASRGIGVAPGSPFSTLAGEEPHVRVTVGLLARTDTSDLTDQLAAAARNGSRGRGR